MVRKSTFENFYKTKNSYFFIQNILYFVSKSVKCILWQILNEIVENQDLYRNKEDFRNILYYKKKHLILMKIFYTL